MTEAPRHLKMMPFAKLLICVGMVGMFCGCQSAPDNQPAASAWPPAEAWLPSAATKPIGKLRGPIEIKGIIDPSGCHTLPMFKDERGILWTVITNITTGEVIFTQSMMTLCDGSRGQHPLSPGDYFLPGEHQRVFAENQP